MNQDLQAWINAQNIDDKMSWKSGACNQALFVRDKVSSFIGVGLHWEQQRSLVRVIAEHRSKSIDLPVYQISREDLKVSFTLRNNFYNWKLSVISERPIEADFTGLFHTTPPIDPKFTGDSLHPAYFEGFPEELIFSYYSNNKNKFSAEISDNYRLCMVLFLCLRDLGAVKPLVWHTPETLKAELATRSSTE